MRLLHKNPHTESIGHGDAEYERDEHGAFELPHELAEDLLDRFPHLWSVAPDPAPVSAKPKRGGKAVKSTESEPSDEPAGDGSQAEDPAITEEPVKEGDGGDAPARASSAGRAPSRRASS